MFAEDFPPSPPLTPPDQISVLWVYIFSTFTWWKDTSATHKTTSTWKPCYCNDVFLFLRLPELFPLRPASVRPLCRNPAALVFGLRCKKRRCRGSVTCLLLCSHFSRDVWPTGLLQLGGVHGGCCCAAPLHGLLQGKEMTVNPMQRGTLPVISLLVYTHEITFPWNFWHNFCNIHKSADWL